MQLIQLTTNDHFFRDGWWNKEWFKSNTNISETIEIGVTINLVKKVEGLYTKDCANFEEIANKISMPSKFVKLILKERGKL